ncbi:MAG: peptidylprolyl isomerase [Gammaproteobacteria bacterium]|nr:peptidylprolyl isomerase [Gammaproteobacteria bacterium]
MPAICRHILVKTKPEAEALKIRLDRGEDFAKLAKEFSICPSGKKGGELGEVRPGQLVPAMDKAVFSLAEGPVHGPIKTSFGYHLLQIKFRY